MNNESRLEINIVISLIMGIVGSFCTFWWLSMYSVNASTTSEISEISFSNIAIYIIAIVVFIISSAIGFILSGKMYCVFKSYEKIIASIIAIILTLFVYIVYHFDDYRGKKFVYQKMPEYIYIYIY